MARKKKTETDTTADKGGSVSLRHTIWKEGERTVHFYDGSLTAKDGVVTIPSDNPAWIRRAWILGYRLDPETNEPVRIEDIVDLNA